MDSALPFPSRTAELLIRHGSSETDQLKGRGGESQSLLRVQREHIVCVLTV